MANVEATKLTTEKVVFLNVPDARVFRSNHPLPSNCTKKPQGLTARKRKVSPRIFPPCDLLPYPIGYSFVCMIIGPNKKICLSWKEV